MRSNLIIFHKYWQFQLVCMSWLYNTSDLSNSLSELVSQLANSVTVVIPKPRRQHTTFFLLLPLLARTWRLMWKLTLPSSDGDTWAEGYLTLPLCTSRVLSGSWYVTPQYLWWFGSPKRWSWLRFAPVSMAPFLPTQTGLYWWPRPLR